VGGVLIKLQVIWKMNKTTGRVNSKPEQKRWKMSSDVVYKLSWKNNK